MVGSGRNTISKLASEALNAGSAMLALEAPITAAALPSTNPLCSEVFQMVSKSPLVLPCQ